MSHPVATLARSRVDHLAGLVLGVTLVLTASCERVRPAAAARLRPHAIGGTPLTISVPADWQSLDPDQIATLASGADVPAELKREMDQATRALRPLYLTELPSTHPGYIASIQIDSIPVPAGFTTDAYLSTMSKEMAASPLQAVVVQPAAPLALAGLDARSMTIRGTVTGNGVTFVVETRVVAVVSGQRMGLVSLEAPSDAVERLDALFDAVVASLAVAGPPPGKAETGRPDGPVAVPGRAW